MSQVYDTAEPIEAWRVWATWGDGKLYATTWSAVEWDPSGITAECVDDLGWCETCPSPPSARLFHLGEGCGIYALKEPKKRAAGFRSQLLGKVLLGGKVYEYTGGYRAEKAKVSAICMPSWNDKMSDKAMRVADRYDVPVIRDPRLPPEPGYVRPDNKSAYGLIKFIESNGNPVAHRSRIDLTAQIEYLTKKYGGPPIHRHYHTTWTSNDT